MLQQRSVHLKRDRVGRGGVAARAGLPGSQAGFRLTSCLRISYHAGQILGETRDTLCRVVRVQRERSA